LSARPRRRAAAVALAANPATRVIAVTGKPDGFASSLEAMRIGAWAYLPKPFSAVQLAILVGQAAHATLTARESFAAFAGARAGGREQRQDSDPLPVPAFRGAISRARKVAPTDASVLFDGRKRRGKELFAQFIHHHSAGRLDPSSR